MKRKIVALSVIVCSQLLAEEYCTLGEEKEIYNGRHSVTGERCGPEAYVASNYAAPPGYIILSNRTLDYSNK